MKRERLFIKKTKGYVKDLAVGEKGYIDPDSIIVFKCERTYFRCIDLYAIVLEEEWDDAILIKRIANTSKPNMTQGEDFRITNSYISFIYTIPHFKWDSENFTSPVAIIPLIEESEKDFLQRSQGQAKTIQINEKSSIEELTKALKANIQAENYEKCVIIQKWIDAKTKRG
ncbi:MAG: hypothetical protein Q4B28_00430 [bacterium]|nr:hypothetical protein [bacterium]